MSTDDHWQLVIKNFCLNNHNEITTSSNEQLTSLMCIENKLTLTQTTQSNQFISRLENGFSFFFFSLYIMFFFLIFCRKRSNNTEVGPINNNPVTINVNDNPCNTRPFAYRFVFFFSCEGYLYKSYSYFSPKFTVTFFGYFYS